MYKINHIFDANHLEEEVVSCFHRLLFHKFIKKKLKITKRVYLY